MRKLPGQAQAESSVSLIHKKLVMENLSGEPFERHRKLEAPVPLLVALGCLPEAASAKLPTLILSSTTPRKHWTFILASVHLWEGDDPRCQAMFRILFWV